MFLYFYVEISENKHEKVVCPGSPHEVSRKVYRKYFL